MQTTWKIDPTHSEVQFKVKHLMISKVTGEFRKFDATVVTNGDDITTAKVTFTADVNSISTNNEQRDAHLRTGDFFEADIYPQLTFESNSLEKIDDENYKVHGTLTMRGVSKPVTFDVSFGGITQDPWGFTRTGFEISGKIHRKDFGINFGLAEAGNVMLSNEVTIHAATEFVKQVKEEAIAA